MDILLNIALPVLRFYRGIDNIHIEGSVSQIFDSELSLYFMSKNGKLLVIFLTLFF